MQEELTVLELFLNNPGIYLKEVQEELFNVCGKWVECSTIIMQNSQAARAHKAKNEESCHSTI